MRWWVWPMLILLLASATTVRAMRSRKPPTFTNLQDPSQLTELNTILADMHDITNGRYTLEYITVNPQEVPGFRKGRMGLKGDMVYAVFDTFDHLCLNTSFPAGTNWTCVNVGTLADCPGGSDTMVQFNDNGDCGGDLGFLYDKNVDRASLGPDASVAQVLSPSPINGGGGSNQILNLTDIRTAFSSLSLGGATVELKATPNGSSGINTLVYSAFLGRLVASGTAGGGTLVAGLDAHIYNAESIFNSKSGNDAIEGGFNSGYLYNLNWDTVGNTSDITPGDVAGVIVVMDMDQTGTGPTYTGGSVY